MKQSHLPSAVLAEMLKESLAKNVPARLEIISDSMIPFLLVGDQVIIESCPIEALQVGDIITYQTAQDLFTHRVRAIVTENGQSWILTRGDRLTKFDEPISAENYIGRLSHKVHNGINCSIQEGKGNKQHQQFIRLATFMEHHWNKTHHNQLTKQAVDTNPYFFLSRPRHWMIRLLGLWLTRGKNVC